MILNGLDWFLLIVAFFSVLRGTWRGAVSQVFGIAGLIGGFWVSAEYHFPVAHKMSQAFPGLPSPGMVSALILFLLTWFGIAMVGVWASWVLHRQGLGMADRVLGAAVGFVKAVVLGVVIVSFLTVFLPSNASVLRRSLFTPYFQKVASYLVRMTPHKTRQKFERHRRELFPGKVPKRAVRRYGVGPKLASERFLPFLQRSEVGVSW